MRDCLKANNAEYRNGDTPRQHNVPFVSLDNTGTKFADLSGNQLPIDFKRLIGLKNFGEIHMSQGIRLGVYPSLPLYIFLGLSYLTIIPRARMGSESIAHEAEGRMGY